MWPCKGCARPGAVSLRKEGCCVAVTDTDIARSPAHFQLPMHKHRQGGGEDVCYFGRSAEPQSRFGDVGSSPTGRNAVAEYAPRSSNSIACSPPTPSTPRGEDRCYIVCETRGRGFESRPVSCAPVAQRIERYPAGFGWPGSQQSPVPGTWSPIVGMIQHKRVALVARSCRRPVVKSAVTS